MRHVEPPPGRAEPARPRWCVPGAARVLGRCSRCCVSGPLPRSWAAGRRGGWCAPGPLPLWLSRWPPPRRPDLRQLREWNLRAGGSNLRRAPADSSPCIAGHQARAAPAGDKAHPGWEHARPACCCRGARGASTLPHQQPPEGRARVGSPLASIVVRRGPASLVLRFRNAAPVIPGETHREELARGCPHIVRRPRWTRIRPSRPVA